MFPCFEEIKKLFTSLDNKIICVVAIKDNIIQGGAFIPWNENSGYYLYGRSIERTHTDAMNHLQREVILKLKQLGVSKYDFVGARLNPKKGLKKEGDKFIGRYTYDGDHCVIMPGAKIGKGSIVGAHSYIDGKFPDFSILRG